MITYGQIYFDTFEAFQHGLISETEWQDYCTELFVKVVSDSRDVKL